MGSTIAMALLSPALLATIARAIMKSIHVHRERTHSRTQQIARLVPEVKLPMKKAGLNVPYAAQATTNQTELNAGDAKGVNITA